MRVRIPTSRRKKKHMQIRLPVLPDIDPDAIAQRSSSPAPAHPDPISPIYPTDIPSEDCIADIDPQPPDPGPFFSTKIPTIKC